jgi:hypothetical protein
MGEFESIDISDRILDLDSSQILELHQSGGSADRRFHRLDVNHFNPKASEEDPFLEFYKSFASANDADRLSWQTQSFNDLKDT